MTPAVDEKSQLPAHLPGKLGHAPRCFRRHDLLGAGFAPAETLDPLELTGLKAGCFPFNFGYDFPPRPLR
jgi:DNA-binding CsgD family transcriptional regulator